MKLGLFGCTSGAMASPELMKEMAPLAEELGFESLWTGEHMVAPSPRVPPSPIEPDHPMLDPMAGLSYLAALTERILLGTGILLIPQRPPVPLAKEAASLDVLSGGRFLMGVGVGYLEPEFDAVGADFANRGPITEEYISAMRALWTMEMPQFHGTTTSFSGIDAHPRPVQPGGPPIIMGGHSKAAFRRAVTLAQGWYGFALDLAGTAACIAGLREAAQRYERPAGYGELTITVTPRGRLDPETVQQFADLGVHRLVPQLRGDDKAGIESFITANAPGRLAR
jgi:probable F420-dependent oxidoreductase